MQERISFANLLVYKKALEIFKVSRVIACSISESKNVIEMQFSSEVKNRFAGDLVSNSLRLAPELALVENSASINARLRGIKKVRRLSRLISERCRKLKFLGVQEQEFLDLLQKEINQFEKLLTEYLYNLQLKKEN